VTHFECRNGPGGGSRHGASHFHALYGEFVAVFDLDTLEVLEGDLPLRAERLVREWSQYYQRDLLEMWRTQEFGQLPGLE